MAEPQTLEEAWEAFRSAQDIEGPGLRDREMSKAARALALAAFEAALLGAIWEDEADLRRRIAELGK